MSKPGEQVLAELPPPDTTRPAAADPIIRTQLDLCSDQIAANRKEPMNIGVVTIVLVIIVFSIDAPQARTIVAGFGGLLLAVWFGRYVCFARRMHRWGSAAPELLTQQPWRAIAVTTVARRVVKPHDESRAGHIRVSLDGAERRLIARTGRVWVVGPDPAGWLALRLDGGAGIYSARLVHPRAGTPAPTPTPTSGGSATAGDDPVTSALARQWAWTHAGWLCGLGLYALAAALFALLLSRWVPALLLLPLLLLPALIRIQWWYRVRVGLALPRRMRTGAWTPVPVTLRPWQTGPRGWTGNVTGTIHLDPDHRVEFEMPVARFDLLDTIDSTGTMWVVGQPRPGQTMVVGFPGYPLLGFARLT
ncbi:MAG: hypothetical protein ACJ72N_25180 [Labedaea sp.]